MKKSFTAILEAALLSATIAVAGCGGTNTSADAGADAGDADAGCPGPGCPGADAGPTTPLPSDPSMYAAWLGTESYRAWRCDPMRQSPLPDSPHGMNIICVNSVLDGARSGSGDWPVGSAAVKLTFDANGNPGPRFLDVRRSAASGAAGWYFMRRNPDGATPVAGMGSEMIPAMACVQCHSSAGRDFVRRVP